MVRALSALQAMENRECCSAGPSASAVDSVADPDDLGGLPAGLLHYSGIHTLSLPDRLDLPADQRVSRLCVGGSAGRAGSDPALRSCNNLPTLTGANQSV